VKLLIAIAASLGFLALSSAWAEPYYAARKGVSCNACHMNETGGFARNDFGRNYGESLQTFDWPGLSEDAPIKNFPSRRLAIAGDLHMGYILNDNTQTSTFDLGRQNFYLMAYLNEAVKAVVSYSPTGAKEVYGIISGLPEGSYIKFGSFSIPYGLMLPDDNSYIRSGLGFTFNRTEVGVEAGIYPDPVFLKLAAFNGNGNSALGIDQQKSFSGWGGFNFTDFTIGGSGYYLTPSSTLGEGYQLRFGSFGWARLWRFVVLGEYDLGYNALDYGASVVDRMIAIHGSMEFDCGNNVYIRLQREFLNPSLAVGDESVRSVGGIRFFPVQNLQVSLDYQLIEPVAGNSAGGFVADTHVFF
jgi:hypothetical protein